MRSGKDLTPCRAIHLKCKECCSGSVKEVRICSIYDCPLYIYRGGKNPKRKGVGGSLSIKAD